MIKGKASELFAKIAPALGEDEARTICKGKIEKGELDDDLGVAPILGKAELDGILELLKGSSPSQMEAQTKPGRTLAKGGTTAESETTTVDLSDLQDQVDALIKRNDDQYSQLAKGITALGRAQTSVVTMLAEMDRRNAEFANTAADLKKTLETISKGQPRSMGGILPHPSEGSRGATTTAAAITGTEDSDEVKLHAKALAYCQEQIAKGAPDARRAELQFAIGELVSGASPSKVIDTYHLALQA